MSSSEPDSAQPGNSESSETPPCFDSPEGFEQWLYLARSSYLDNPVRSYCHDCTPAYKAEMEAEGRCSFPDVRFAYVKPTSGSEDPEPFLAGLREAGYRIMKRLKRLTEGPDDGNS